MNTSGGTIRCVEPGDARPEEPIERRGLGYWYAPIIDVWRDSPPRKRWLVAAIFAAIYVFMATLVGTGLLEQELLDADGVSTQGWILKRQYNSRPGRHRMEVRFEADGQTRTQDAYAPALASFAVEGCWDGDGRSYPAPETGSEARAQEAKTVCREDGAQYLPYEVRVRYLPSDPATLRVEGKAYLGFDWFGWVVVGLPFALLLLTPIFRHWDQGGFGGDEDEDDWP